MIWILAGLLVGAFVAVMVRLWMDSERLLGLEDRLDELEDRLEE